MQIHGQRSSFDQRTLPEPFSIECAPRHCSRTALSRGADFDLAELCSRAFLGQNQRCVPIRHFNHEVSPRGLLSFQQRDRLGYAYRLRPKLQLLRCSCLEADQGQQRRLPSDVRRCQRHRLPCASFNPLRSFRKNHRAFNGAGMHIARLCPGFEQLKAGPSTV